MFRRLRSNAFLLIPSPADKYIAAIFLVVAAFGLNVLLRTGESKTIGFVERHYQNFYNCFNGNHLMIYVVGHFIVVFGSYWTIGGIYTLIDVIKKPEFLTRFKIQEDKNSPSTNPSISQCVRQVFFNQCLVLPFTIGNFFMVSRFGDVNFRPDQLPSWTTLFLDLGVNSTLLEICFYYNHRILHHPYLYKHIHKKHHEWVTPIAISFFYTHPIEHTVGVLVPFVLGQYIRPTHILSALLWVFIAIVIGLNEHCGYHFPMLASTEFHDYHHLRFNQNYGLVGLMDWIHGSSKDFVKSSAYKRHFSFFGSTPLKFIIPDKPKDYKQELDSNANNYSH